MITIRGRMSWVMKMLNSHKCGDAIKTDTNKKIDGV